MAGSESPITTRRRVIPAPQKGYVRGDLTYGSFDTTSKSVNHASGVLDMKNLQGWQTTTSENHPEWRPGHRPTIGDIGGSFFTEKAHCLAAFPPQSIAGLQQVTPSFWSYANYVGPVLPIAPAFMSFPPAFPSGNSTLDAVGAQAIARCKPTNAVADLSTFLGETLREGLPRVIGSAEHWRSKSSAGKKAGGEYLNAQFGWAPFVHDIRSISNAISNAESIMAQYERDSGRVVRRRYEFPPEEHLSETLVKDNCSPYVLQSSEPMYNSQINKGKVWRMDKTIRRRWFSGGFTYYLPTGGNTRENMARSAALAKKTLGLRLTPDVVWNLAPWSWAVDWFTNTGDVISNVTDWATDGLVLKYGYVMETTVSERTYYFMGPTGFKSDVIPSPVTLVVTTKVRRRANPFGFGVTWGGLSPRQLSIAAALGLTRGR